MEELGRNWPHDLFGSVLSFRQKKKKNKQGEKERTGPVSRSQFLPSFVPYHPSRSKVVQVGEMELRSGYLTPVKSQGQREALSTPEDSTSGREFGNRLKHERKEREQQEAGIEISPPSMHQNPAFTSFPAFPSAPAWNPMQLNGFSQIPSLMPHLPQDTMVKVEGADGIGHLDPHYLEQYRGKHLPSLTARQPATGQHLQF